MDAASGVEIHQIISREQWLELRKPNIGASEVAALIGLHPYQTYAGLTAEKKGVVFPDKDSGPLRRGRWYEDGVRNAVAELRPDWMITKATEYYRDPKLRLGATPDFHITVANSARRGVLQTKTVERSAFKKYWTETTPPFWIALQVTAEMMLTGAEFGAIGAGIFDPFNPEVHIYEVPRHPEAEKRIEEELRKFWFNFNHGVEPVIDFEHDGALLSVLYPRQEPGKQIDLRTDNQIGELLDARESLRDLIKTTQQKCEAVETEIKAKLKDAESALVRGYRSVTFKQQSRKEYTVAATSFRVLRAVKDQKEEIQ